MICEFCGLVDLVCYFGLAFVLGLFVAEVWRLCFCFCFDRWFGGVVFGGVGYAYLDFVCGCGFIV